MAAEDGESRVSFNPAATHLPSPTVNNKKNGINRKGKEIKRTNRKRSVNCETLSLPPDLCTDNDTRENVEYHAKVNETRCRNVIAAIKSE